MQFPGMDNGGKCQEMNFEVIQAPVDDLQESMSLGQMKGTIRNSNMMSQFMNEDGKEEDDESFSSSDESSDTESD